MQQGGGSYAALYSTSNVLILLILDYVYLLYSFKAGFVCNFKGGEGGGSCPRHSIYTHLKLRGWCGSS